MNKEIDCIVVKDLLASYIDKLTSKETNQILERHLSTCDGCTKDYEEMRGTLKVDKVPTQSSLDIFRNKIINKNLLRWISSSIGFIGILISTIVDLAMNRRLTWSLIVDAGVLYLYITAMAAVFSKKKKVLIATLVSSVFVFPLLYVIEFVVNEYYLMNPMNWYEIYALPITLIWLSIIWSSILFRRFIKINVWYNLSLMFLLIMIGSIFTNVIVYQVSIYEVYKTNLGWLNFLSTLACAITCYIIGYRRKNKRGK